MLVRAVATLSAFVMGSTESDNYNRQLPLAPLPAEGSAVLGDG